VTPSQLHDVLLRVIVPACLQLLYAVFSHKVGYCLTPAAATVCRSQDLVLGGNEQTCGREGKEAVAIECSVVFLPCRNNVKDLVHLNNR
jgi:hypothetical protein